MGPAGIGGFPLIARMVTPHSSSLFRDMIADAQRFSEHLRIRRAEAIAHLDSPDILAFYDKEIVENDRRILMMKVILKEKNR